MGGSEDAESDRNGAFVLYITLYRSKKKWITVMKKPMGVELRGYRSQFNIKSLLKQDKKETKITTKRNKH